MNHTVIVKSFTSPPICEKEILRYARCKDDTPTLLSLLRECLAEAEFKLTYKVCYIELELTVREDVCDFGVFKLNSKGLASNLKGSDSVIIFAATVGIELDRLIAKYSRISPSKALFMQALGAERIEALCDAFCDSLISEKGVLLRPRFSPGYGDLPLEVQKDIFSLLECHKRIGVSLNESLLMSPSKSVTAFVGLEVQK